MTQHERIMNRLEKGPLTQLDAINELGIMRLASRISELKKSGAPIVSRMVKINNRFGEKCIVACYELIK